MSYILSYYFNIVFINLFLCYKKFWHIFSPLYMHIISFYLIKFNFFVKKHLICSICYKKTLTRYSLLISLVFYLLIYQLFLS